MALGQLLAGAGWAAPVRRQPTRWLRSSRTSPGKAKSVIFLFMAGAPSHLELFDYKPQLAKFDGTLPPADLLKGYRAAFINPNSKLLGPEVQVRQLRHSPARNSPSCCRILAKVVDDIAIVKSMVTDAFNHAPGQILMNTGSQQFGRPSMGAWVTYGLGSESEDLPAFVVFSSGKKGPERRRIPAGAAAFCPRSIRACSSAAAATRCCIFRIRAAWMTELQRDSLDAIRSLNQMRLDVTGDPEIATRINSFEMAFRMQTQRAGADGHFAKNRNTSSRCTAPSRASRRSPTTACWRGGWSNAACVSCSSSTKPGTSTATW